MPNEREARKRQRELERLHKEQAKLSALQQARLEVDEHENSLDVLLSIHKEASSAVDWLERLSVLPPHKSLMGDLAAFEREYAECENQRSLAKRILAGESKAYKQAIKEHFANGELRGLGSSMSVTVHHAKLIECQLLVNGREIIPADAKSLTAAGKVSVKAMPKGRFHEMYQDYVCGCVLRLGREMLVLLPIDDVIVTAKVVTTQESTGNDVEIPVLSVALSRNGMAKLDFDRLDPSDSMENFPHRGDVLASRKSGEFSGIEPLNPADLAPNNTVQFSLAKLVERVREMRAEYATNLKKLETNASDSVAEKQP